MIPNLPSPTVIVGNRPQVDPQDIQAVQAARQGPNTQIVQPQGWSYAPYYCYRNAVLVMLLSSDRFMGYIEKYHLQVIHNLRDKTPDDDDFDFPPLKGHTDILLEIYQLWVLFSDPQRYHLMPVQMDLFWEYARKVGKDFELEWTFKDEQDVHEFLTWIFDIYTKQADQWIEDHPLAQQKKALDSIMQLAAVVMHRCVDCRQTKNEKVRSDQADYSYAWNLSLIHI